MVLLPQRLAKGETIFTHPQRQEVKLGLNCADICRALDRAMNGKKLDDLSPSVREVITQLTTWVEPSNA